MANQNPDAGCGCGCLTILLIAALAGGGVWYAGSSKVGSAHKAFKGGKTAEALRQYRSLHDGVFSTFCDADVYARLADASVQEGNPDQARTYIKEALNKNLDLYLTNDGARKICDGVKLERNPDNTTTWKAVNEPADAGHDPHAFKTAADMMKVPDCIPMGAAGETLLIRLDEFMATGAPLETADGWVIVRGLNPYRCSSQLQEVAMETARKMAASIGGPGGAVPQEAMKKANTLYRAGRFEEASQAYRDILLKCPACLDARSNLALSELHLGQDLAAQIECETLRCHNEKYLPGLVNLAVVYERLGRAGTAATLARQAYNLNKALPIAAYNHAWYLSQDRDFAGAAKLLSGFKGFEKKLLGGKMQELITLNDKLQFAPGS